MEDASLLHDHSTSGGRFSLFLHRINLKYLVPPAALLLGFAAIAALVATANTTMGPNLQQLTPGNSMLGAAAPATGDNPGWTVIKQSDNGIFDAEGCENGLYPFEGLDSPTTAPGPTMKSLKLRDLVIDAAALTKSLQKWTNLETIVIENVWVNGNFSRVHLPQLRKFIFHQFRNGKTDAYKLPESLREILFFDQSAKTWDLNKDLVNLNITVQVTIEGTKILDIEPQYGELNINTHFCEEMFKNFNPAKSRPLTSLTLSWCPVGNATLDAFRKNGKDLKFLFLNNAIPYSTEEWTDITTSLKSLEELHVFLRFHCDWPGYEIFMNVSNFSPTITTFSVTNLDISFEPEMPAASVKHLSLDQYVGDNVCANFTTVFPNVESVALFNISQDKYYHLIRNVLQGHPQTLIVTNLTRISEPRGRSNEATEVEIKLGDAGVPAGCSNFILEASPTGVYVGKALSAFERNFYRYKRLAFYKMDTYADYVTWDADPK